MPNQTEVQLLVTAKDQATATLKKVGGSLDGLVKVAKGVGAGLAVAGSAAGAFAVDSIKAFADAEVQTKKSLQKINNGIENMSVKSLNALQKMADKANGDGADIFQYAEDSIMSAADAAVQLGFDDEDAADSMATLFQRTGDVNEAIKLNAIAMDIARGKGIDLADANRMVNLILSGNTKELKLQGIEVDDNATGMENLTAVQAKFAGQAATYAQTTSGKLEIMSKSWGNVQESLGAALVEGLKVNDWLDKLSKFITSEAFQNGLKKFGEYVTVAVKGVVSSIKWLRDTFETVFYYMFRTIDIVSEKWSSLKNTISSVSKSIQGSWNSLKDTLSSPIDGIINIAEKITGKKKDKKALGGPVTPGNSYIVGENRPEIFEPNQSGNIRQMNEAGSGKIEVTFNNVNVRSDYDLDTIVKAVKDAIARTQTLERAGIRTV